jgi:putative ABC transport system permease protein
MSQIWKLGLSYLRHHPARLILTSLAMVAAACMVIWVVSGYDALLKQFKEFAGVSHGRYTLMVYPTRLPMLGSGGTRPVGTRPSGMMPGGAFQMRSVPTEIAEQIRADSAIAVADLMWSAPAMVMPYDPQTFRRLRLPTTSATRPLLTRPTTGLGGPRGRGGVSLIGIDSPQPPFPMSRGRWIDPRSDVLEAALSVDAAYRLGVDLGGEVSAGVGEKAQKLVIVGIVDVPIMPGGGMRRPQARGPAGGGLYVPMKVAELIHDRPSQISAVGLIARPGVDITKFRFGWQARFDKCDPPLQFQDAQELEDELDSSQTARNMLMQAYSATGISLLAALFIIFTTLSMGVSERARQFAVLRAVALTRGQIAGLIAFESLILAVLGWIGGVGAGWALLWIVSKAHPSLLEGGALLGKWSLALSAACAFGGALCAAIVPTLRAIQLRPLDAMAPRTSAHHLRWPVVSTCIGAVLIAINPLLTFIVPMGHAQRYAIYMAVGCVSMGIGFILMAPAAVAVAERVFSPLLSLLLGLERGLLKRQLISNIWRTVGTGVAMTIGLGLFVAMQVWGYTMLRPFEPGAWVPDAMIAFLPEGLPPSDHDAVARLPGLDSRSCLPLAVEQPKLTDDVTGSETRASVVRQDNIVLIGLDPDRGIGGDHPLLKLDWVAGSPKTAVPLLKQGRHCIVPDHFCRESKLKLGDSFRLNAPADNTQPISYTIAGVVRLPGWHWMSKFSGVRLSSGRSAAMVFASYESVARDFKLTNVRFYWSNTPGQLDEGRLAEEARRLAENRTGLTYQLAGRGFPQMDGGNTVRITTPVTITQRIRARADTWIWGLSRLPLVTLAVASLGVLNAMMASVRARTWELGVMRALGFTRSCLVRVVVAESLLVGIVACLLSLGFGVMAGWCGAGISQYVSFFGGMQPALVIPWSKVSLGLGGAIGLCILAALWPAIVAGRAEPLRLLQAGRTAM